MGLALFGTDGVRGVANDTLTVALALDIARGVAGQLPRPARVLVGRDTRVSGPMLEAALVAGLTECGVDTVLVGVLPTPALAHLARAMEADAAIMISASHNPPQYNGIKVIDGSGRKWEPEQEAAVERAIQRQAWPRPQVERVGSVLHFEETAVGLYRRHLVSIFNGRLPNWPVVLDVGHGAAAFTAPPIFQQLGIPARVLNAEPLGELINVESGATHPDVVREAVLRHQARLGFAFDGDADRVIAVDHTGHVIDGDEILYLLARDLKERGQLVDDVVVATVMSNLGLERALGRVGVQLRRTPVGDRWVAKVMRDTGAQLGGEQSGHIILKEWTETGDGVLTALAILDVLARRPHALEETKAAVERFPQILVNVPLPQRVDEWRDVPGLGSLVASAEEALGDEGRVLIRPSGTEPLLRIMLEGRDVTLIQEWAHRLETGVRLALESAEV
ncbi:MAG: phosphoglucosamine mutase [Firmicutes bacterium]|nr:phosphoglucosamine mutase [Bacillota bacterium]